jgi:hypothetical protein
LFAFSKRFQTLDTSSLQLKLAESESTILENADSDKKARCLLLEEKLAEAETTIQSLRNELKSTKKQLEAADVARQHVERYVDSLRHEVRGLGEQLQRVKTESSAGKRQPRAQNHHSDKEEGEITLDSPSPVELTEDLLKENTTDALTAAAEAAIKKSGFTYDESSGWYYDTTTSLFYDPVGACFSVDIFHKIVPIAFFVYAHNRHLICIITQRLARIITMIQRLSHIMFTHRFLLVRKLSCFCTRTDSLPVKLTLSYDMFVIILLLFLS